MKTKSCAGCAKPTTVAYRIRTAVANAWHFVCPQCLPGAQGQAGYRYGGTWKGARH